MAKMAMKKRPIRRRPYRPRMTQAERNKRFTKKVDQVLTAKLETKKRTVTLGGANSTTPLNITASGLADTGFGVHIGNIWNSNNITVEQGTQTDQHIGREIQNCSLWLKGCVQATFYNLSTNNNQYPFDVYMIVYKDKSAPNTNSPDYIKQGNHAVGRIDGTPTNFMLPFNKDRYTIYTNRRIARFKPMPFDRTEGPTGSVLQNPTIGSGNNLAFKYFSYKMPCPKTLSFKSAGSNLVTNAHLGVGFYVINGSGTALGNTQIRATVYPVATLYYKDA